MDPHAQQAARRQEFTAMALAAIAGFVDAYGIVRYGTYLSFMSGNTTQAGYHTGLGDFAVLPLLLTGIAGFLLGSFAGNYYGHPFGRLTRRLTLSLIAVALAFALGHALIGLSPKLLSVAVLSFAMGAMNTSLPSVGKQAVNLTFVTGTLNRLGTHLALAARGAPLSDSDGAWDTHARRALWLAGIWAGFLLGAVLSGAVTALAGPWALLAPIGALLLLAALG
ncbi:MAG: YoaK family protein [Rhizomicrobium sp.]